MIQLLWVIILAVALAYSTLILLFYYGWKKLPVFLPPTGLEADVFVSVIIAARNEENNIRQLLDCIAKQDYPPGMFEVIVVDDHSEGHTTWEIIKLSTGNVRLIQLGNNEQGKKRAIYRGVMEAKGRLIVTTDADCTMQEHWLSTMVAFYKEYKPNMMVAPVVYTKSKKTFQSMQALEFLSLVGSGAGAIGINHAIMCNGANLAFEKNVLQDISPLREEIASGDDIMLLLHIKKQSGQGIKFIKSKEATVETAAEPYITSFFEQRKRWVSKSRVYRDFDIIVASSIVFLINALLSFLFIGAFFYSYFWYTWGVLFSVKFVIDYLFLSSVTKFFGRRKLMYYYPALQGIYFLYVNIVSLAGFFVKYNWKGRSQR